MMIKKSFCLHADKYNNKGGENQDHKALVLGGNRNKDRDNLILLIGKDRFQGSQKIVRAVLLLCDDILTLVRPNLLLASQKVPDKGSQKQ